MKKLIVALFPVVLFIACDKTNNSGDVVSQKYIHKYGIEMNEKEWVEHERDGKVISSLKNGVIVVKTYKNGKLHGVSSDSFPRSETIKNLYEYDNGTLLKHILYDIQGQPIKEIQHSGKNYRIITFWNKKGIPLRKEEYENDLLIQGEYFTANHEKESQVNEGNGIRIKRDQEGLLLAKDEIAQGKLTQRTTFYPNGQIQSISPFFDYHLHGKQQTFSPAGLPIMELNWDHGKLHGNVITYQNGKKVREVHYFQGEKEGLEIQLDNEGVLLAEIPWEHDQKHGSCHFYRDDETSIQWYFRGKEVSPIEFETLDWREKLIAELNQ